MFKKILLPTDGSGPALRAAETVAEQAKTVPGAHITIVVAIAFADAEHSDLDAEVLKRQNDRMCQHAKDALQTVAAIFEQRGVGYTTKIVDGDPASAAIAQEAETGDYDLIVMSSNGLGMLRSDPHYAGSITEHVIRRVRIPVLVIPQHHDA